MHRLMKLLTGNVSNTIDQLAKEMGFTPRYIYRYIGNPVDTSNIENPKGK